MKKFEWTVFGLVAFTVGAATAAVLAYRAAFARNGIGDPEAWGQFGDYLGGVVNPVVGIVTVVLVVMTLRVTRLEAQAARRQIAQQLQYMERQSLLSDMHKRLEGVLAEWERVMSRRAPRGFQSFQVTADGPSVSNKTVQEVLEDNELRASLIEDDLKTQYPDLPKGDERFAAFKGDLVELAVELDQYCLKYDEVAGTRHLTFFYRNRLKRSVEMLRLAGVMETTVAKRYEENRMP